MRVGRVVKVEHARAATLECYTAQHDAGSWRAVACGAAMHLYGTGSTEQEALLHLREEVRTTLADSPSLLLGEQYLLTVVLREEDE